MTLTKFQIIDAMAEQNRLTRKKSTDTDRFSNLINIMLENDQKGVCNETY